MLAIQNLSIRAGTKELLNSASLSIHPGQKIGLVGKNGAGKTTLFKTILNEMPIDAGQVNVPANWLIGCVEQETVVRDALSLDYVCDGDSLYAVCQKKVSHCEELGDHDGLVKAYDEMDKISGYEVPNKARQILYGLGFSGADFAKPFADFSGGWQVRLKLARALMQRSDLLLLDEPTNHLDIEAVNWLEQWLKSYAGAILVISHDRDFLDQVVQGIAQIEHQKINFYKGNFASYERQRNEQLMQQQALHDKQKQQMQHLKSFIERFKAKASKAKQAQSRVKALSRMEEVAAVQATNPFRFQFVSSEHQPDPMVYVEKVTFSYTDTPILNEVDLVLRKGDRIGLVGINGSGKTTLLRQVVGELKPQQGKVVLSRGVKIGYFAQHQLDSLVMEQSPLQHLLVLDKDEGFEERITDQKARDFLGQFGFSNNQCLDPIKHFSGGEKARLALALIVFQKPNLIVLDEPTNHLDMDTRDALDMAIQEFDGAIILVTHDKHLLASISDKFWWVHDGTVTDVHGDLDSYLQQQLRAVKDKQLEQKGPKSTSSKKEIRQQSAMSRKQLEAKVRPYKKELSKLEAKLEELQADLNDCHTQMEQAAFYDESNKEQIEACILKESNCRQQIEEIENRWLELDMMIEEVKGDFSEG